MNIQDVLEKMKNLQSCMLNFIDSEEDEEENFQNLIKLIEMQMFEKNASELKILLRLIVSISNNHHRGANFFTKIEQILNELKNDIQQNFTNSEIFRIFKSSKRLLLFFITEKVIIIDKSIFQYITEFKYKLLKYPQYFSKEIKPFMQEMQQQSQQKEESDFTKQILKEEPDDFNEKRLKGENDELICELIRNDSIEEFITLENKEKFSLKKFIQPSIYETNRFLMNRNPTLIQYAAFFGAVQIFKYLHYNKVEITPDLWMYAAHSDNPEMISLLEDSEEKKDKVQFKEIVLEAIKCHNNDVANYIRDKYDKEKVKLFGRFDFGYNFDEQLLSYTLCYCNFLFVPANAKDNDIFLYACKYDYVLIVKLLLSSKRIDINKISIFCFNI